MVSSDQSPVLARASLREEADQNVPTIADQVALGDLDIRKDFAKEIIRLFSVTNGFVLALIVALMVADWVMTGNGMAVGDRVITSAVVMSILGATTVQLGAVVLVMANYLFPKKS